MDPNACIERIVNACDGSDHGDLFEAMNDLYDWLKGGGFAPHSPTKLGEHTVPVAWPGSVPSIRFETRPRELIVTRPPPYTMGIVFHLWPHGFAAFGTSGAEIFRREW